MSSRSDFVSIEVDDQRIDTWIEYRVVSDLLTPADAFSMTIEVGLGRGSAQKDEFTRLKRLLIPNAPVKLYVGADVHGGSRLRALQLTGIIDDVEIGATRSGGGSIAISGRDLACHLCDSAVPVSLIREQSAGGTLIDLARAAVAPWGIQVISDTTAARNVLTGAASLTPEQRLRVEQARAQGIPAAFMTQHIMRESQAAQTPIDEFTGTTPSARSRRRSSTEAGVGSDIERLRVSEASPRAGESVWSFLERHAQRLHVMMWMSPRGDLMLGAPRYDQAPRYHFVRRFINDENDPNNVSEMSVRFNGADRYSKVTVYGRVHGQDVARARIRAVAEDADLPFERRKIEHLNDCTTQAHADSAAKRILREGIASAEVIEVSADDHGQGRYLYAVDTIADVLDEYSEVYGPRYVTSRTFERSRERGTHTRLRLVQPNSLTL